MAEAPSLDDKARYEALKKELIQALPKKRAIDKQLVRSLSPITGSKLNVKTTTGRHRVPNPRPRKDVSHRDRRAQWREHHQRVRGVPQEHERQQAQVRRRRQRAPLLQQQPHIPQGEFRPVPPLRCALECQFETVTRAPARRRRAGRRATVQAAQHAGRDDRDRAPRDARAGVGPVAAEEVSRSGVSAPEEGECEREPAQHERRGDGGDQLAPRDEEGADRRLIIGAFSCTPTLS